jgi:hypothetical protein
MKDDLSDGLIDTLFLDPENGSGTFMLLELRKA